MNGLRIYIYASATEMDRGDNSFYSRRGSGPYYRWHYAKDLEQWRGSRVPSSELMPKALSAATWKTLPLALQAKLGEHYME